MGVQSSNSAELFFDGFRIGVIKNIFCSDDTWYGEFELNVADTDRAVLGHVAPFIAFCEDWHHHEISNQADVKEFGPYQNVLQTGRWIVMHSDGVKHSIAEAPVFFPRGEVSWRTS
jgi:hypothetical protein